MDNNTYNNIITFLKLFKNRPYHLAKYLLDNNALNSDFIKNINNSDKLKQLSSSEDLMINFNSIEQMEDFYHSLINLEDSNNKTIEEIENDLNLKLSEFIKNEDYESAANLRDYMKRKKIKKR